MRWRGQPGDGQKKMGWKCHTRTLDNQRGSRWGSERASRRAERRRSGLMKRV